MKKTISCGLAALVILVSPGPLSFQAAAAGLGETPAEGGGEKTRIGGADTGVFSRTELFPAAPATGVPAGAALPSALTGQEPTVIMPAVVQPESQRPSAPLAAVAAGEILGNEATGIYPAPDAGNDPTASLEAIREEHARRFDGIPDESDIASLPTAVSMQRVPPGPPSAVALAEPPQRPERPAARPTQPRSSALRAVKVGLVAAGLDTLVAWGLPAAAAALGHQPGSSAVSLGAEAPTPAKLLVAGLVMAPIAQEVVFRAGVFGFLNKILGGRRFWIPALVSAGLYVKYVQNLDSEDTFLSLSRYAGAFILARAYAKEGLLASITANSVFNAVKIVPVVVAITYGLNFDTLSSLAYSGLTAGAALAGISLMSQSRAVREGRIVAYRLSGAMALLLSAILVAGVFGFTQSLFAVSFAKFWYLAAALGLGVYGLWNSRGPRG